MDQRHLPVSERSPGNLPEFRPDDAAEASEAAQRVANDAGSPSSRLRASDLLAGLDARFPEPRISVGALIDALGDTGLGIVLIIFALPSFIPTPGLPVGFVSGTVVALIALQVMAGRHTLWLPAKLRRVDMPRDILIKAAALLAKPMRWTERWLQPRHSALTGRVARMLLALPILILAVSIVLPIPLGNQAPSVALIMFGFGLIERDGLAILAAIILSIIAMIWLAFIILFGVEAAGMATAWIASFGWF
jgi:hypothetical protein